VSTNYSFSVARKTAKGVDPNPLFEGTSTQSTLFLMFGKYGYTSAAIRTHVKTIKSLALNPSGMYTILLEDSGGFYYFDGFLIDKIVPRESGYAMIRFRHVGWYALTQNPPTYARSLNDETPPLNFLKSMLEEKPFSFTVQVGTHENNPALNKTGFPQARTQINARNYTCTGKRGVDILDEICYRSFLEWAFEPCNEQTVKINIGKFPVAGPTVMDPLPMEVSYSYVPIFRTVAPGEYRWKMDSHEPVMAEGGYFEVYQLPTANFINPCCLIKHGDNVYITYLVSIRIYNGVARVRYYISPYYLPPTMYFSKLCPENQFAMERYIDACAIRNSLSHSTPQRVRIFKNTSNHLVDAYQDTSSFIKTKEEYLEKNKAVTLKGLKRISPYARKNAGIFFPEPPAADEATDEKNASAIIIKPDGSMDKGIVLGEIMQENNVQKGPGDFLLIFPNGDEIKYEYDEGTGKGKWILKADSIELNGSKALAFADHKHTYIAAVPPFQGPTLITEASNSNTQKTGAG